MYTFFRKKLIKKILFIFRPLVRNPIIEIRFLLSRIKYISIFHFSFNTFCYRQLPLIMTLCIYIDDRMYTQSILKSSYMMVLRMSNISLRHIIEQQ